MTSRSQATTPTTGIGDLSLIGIVRPWSWVGEEILVRTTLLGGLKFSSGDSDRLSEEAEEGHHEEGVTRAVAKPKSPMPTGGSDFGALVVASRTRAWRRTACTDTIWRWDRFGRRDRGRWRVRELASRVRVGIRPVCSPHEGSFDFRYANELGWSAAIGAYPLLGESPNYSLALLAAATGVYKGNDEFEGESVTDSRVSFVFLARA